MRTKGINTVDYEISAIGEVELNVYLVTIQKVNKINEGPLHKYFIVDAIKDEKSAAIR